MRPYNDSSIHTYFIDETYYCNTRTNGVRSYVCVCVSIGTNESSHGRSAARARARNALDVNQVFCMYYYYYFGLRRVLPTTFIIVIIIIQYVYVRVSICIFCIRNNHAFVSQSSRDILSPRRYEKWRFQFIADKHKLYIF